MGFRTGAWAKVWEVEDKGKYLVVSMSTSKKDKETGQYETDWSNKFVRFVGEAAKADIKPNDRIKIGDCDVTSHYDKEKKITYTNYVVFSFEIGDDDKPKNTKASKKDEEFMKVPDTVDGNEELPFA